MKHNSINWKCPFIFMVAALLSGVSFSALAAGPAFTGLAAKADTAETVFLNPAGMSRMKQPAFYGNPQFIYTESNTEVSVQGQSSKQTIDSDGFIFLPGLYYVRPLNDRWSFGIGPNAASGLGATYNDNWAGRYLVEEWSEVFIGVVPSVSYRVNDALSIGFSLSLNYSLFTLEKAVFNGPGQADGSFVLEADGIGVGANLGFLYEFNPLSRIGIVYRSEVKAEDEGTPDISGLSNARRTLLENAGVLNQEISMDTNIPQSVLAGIFHDFDNGWTMSADILWLDFSEWNIDNITIGDTTISKDSTDYQDIWVTSLGATYALRPDWSLRGGVLYLSSAVEDEDRTLMTRYDAMWAIGGGVEHAFRNKRKVAVDLTYFQFGDGEFAVSNVPVVGSIRGEYETNYGISLGVSTTW
ncbi:MAG: outer membrane protein transport protein [Desulfobacterales bacterium]